MRDPVLRTSARAVFALQYHVVFVTRYRHRCITAPMLEVLEAEFRRACLAWRCELLEFGGESDHVHLLVAGHPAVELSSLVSSLKTVSARTVRKAFAAHLRKYCWKPTFWSGSYAVFSVGTADLKTVVNYIRGQESPA